MTELEHAKLGTITEKVCNVSSKEGVDPSNLRKRIEDGRVVILGNTARNVEPVGVGEGLRTKVNASIGTSSDIVDLDMEVEKAKTAEAEGADTLMELSTGGDFDLIRRTILQAVNIPVGTVPLYQAAIETIRKHGSVVKMDKEFLFDTIEKQVEDGVDFMAIHCGVNRTTIERLKKQGYRTGGLVSRGGAFLVAWMMVNNKENPLFEHFDRVCDILKKRDVVLSLGNGMRAGAIDDSNDRAMIQELIINCELCEEARRKGCQVMVEGPGHIPIDEIELNVKLQKRLSGNAPYYVLGPVPTDVSAGYDHIASVAGAALSAAYGADLVCYLTPAEHLGLPFPEDVREGVRATRIAVHMGDMVKYGRKERDRKVAISRKNLDWEGQLKNSMFRDRFMEIRRSRPPESPDTCTMCGEFCALKIVRRFFEG